VRPLSLIAIGLVAIVVDIRTEYFDMLPDPIGWGLVALGAWRLSLPLAAAAAGAAALLSMPEVSLPYRFVAVRVPLAGGGFQTTDHLVFDDLTGWRLATATAAALAGAAAAWILVGALAGRAAAWQRRPAAVQLRWLRWLTLVVWAAPYLGVLAASVWDGDPSFDPVWNGNLEFVALAGVMVVAALVLVLLRESNRAWAVPFVPSNALDAPRSRADQPRFDERG
jgi:hypothetical protein